MIRKPRFPRGFSSEDQERNLGQSFEAIRTGLAKITAGSAIGDDPSSILPERVVVFEVIGRVMGLANAAVGVGFEWLAEWATDDDAEEEEEEEDNDHQALGGVPGSLDFLYLSMPSATALNSLLELWDAFRRREVAGRARQPWWNLFKYLKDVRVWSPRDRVEAIVATHLRSSSANPITGMLRMEFDLWFRGTSEARDAAAADVATKVQQVGGTVLDVYVIEAIHYLGMLVDLPPRQAVLLADLQGPIATAAALMTVRPQSMSTHPGEEAEGVAAASVREARRAFDARAPVAALLDGPIADAHELLRNRVRVTEVDVPASMAGDRAHGTAMASLIIHGDLDGEASTSPARTLAVVPVLQGGKSSGETTPPDRLVLRTIHRAIMALVQGVDGRPAAARSVVIVNHSICDDQSSFRRRPSPWARLLDYLSFEYRLLFVVSAGNWTTPLALPEFRDRASFLEEDFAVRQAKLLESLQRDVENRRLRAPAESLNALTIGSIHSDMSAGAPTGIHEPFATAGLPALFSATGPGTNASVKPDAVDAGGRQSLILSPGPGSSGLRAWGRTIGGLGHLTAAPSPDGFRRSVGTSNSAALATRSGIHASEVVEQVFKTDGIDWLDLPSRAAILKTLITHGCQWSDFHREQATNAPGSAKERNALTRMIERFVGNGVLDAEILQATEGQRITLLAEGSLGHDELHEYRLPIPPALLRSPELRRLTLTLSWMSPINPGLSGYREVALKLIDDHRGSAFWTGVKTTKQPTAARQGKGTLIHRVLEGFHRTSKDAPGGIFVGVQARALRGLEYDGPQAPYALAVSLEVGPNIPIELYDFVAATVRSPTVARTPVRVGMRDET